MVKFRSMFIFPLLLVFAQYIPAQTAPAYDVPKMNNSFMVGPEGINLVSLAPAGTLQFGTDTPIAAWGPTFDSSTMTYPLAVSCSTNQLCSTISPVGDPLPGFVKQINFQQDNVPHTAIYQDVNNNTVVIQIPSLMTTCVAPVINQRATTNCPPLGNMVALPTDALTSTGTMSAPIILQYCTTTQVCSQPFIFITYRIPASIQIGGAIANLFAEQTIYPFSLTTQAAGVVTVAAAAVGTANPAITLANANQ